MSDATQDQIDAEFEDTVRYSGSKFKTWRLSKECPKLVLRFFIMKSLKKTKKNSSYHEVHWYPGFRTDDPSKPRSWPVLTSEEKHWDRGAGKFVTDKVDPMKALRERAEAARKTARAKFEAGEMDAKTFGEKDARLDGWLRDHGLNKKHRLYGIDQEGNLGVCQLNGRAYKSVLAESDKRQKAGKPNPFDSVGGVFFEIERGANAFTDAESVKIFSVEKDIPGVGATLVIPTHDLTQEMKARAVELLPNFDEEDARIRYDDEVMEALAKNANDPRAITDIICAAKPEMVRTGPDRTAAEPQNYEGAGGDFDTGASTPVEKATVPETKSGNSMDEIAALRAKLAAAEAAAKPAAAKEEKSAKPAAKPPVKQETKAKQEPAKTPDAMSGADFDAEFGD